MRNPLMIVPWLFCSFLVCCGGVWGKSGPPGTLSDYTFIETPQALMNPPDLAGFEKSMFRAAAANTVVLGWWQFDSSGAPDKQGWTEHDLTVQEKKYWHVAGTPVGCDAITPIASNRRSRT